MEDKQKICNLLTQALQATRLCSDLESLTYVTPEQPHRYDSYVEAKFQGDSKRIINTSMDSGFAMIRDIIDHI